MDPQQQPHPQTYDYEPQQYQYDSYNYQQQNYDSNYFMEDDHHLNAYSSQSKEYEVLPYNALFAQVEKHLKTAKEMTALGEGWCLLLLREFKWDVEKLSDYFQDVNRFREKIGYQEGFGNPDQLKKFEGSCDVCCAEGQKLYANVCGHGFCEECWKNHLSTSILSANPFMKCMGCTCPVLNETVLSLLHLFYPLERKLLDSYQKQISQQFSTIHRNYQFCTGVDCGNCIKVYNLNLRSVKCTCGKVFCFKCKSDDHSPCTCEEKKLWMENVLKEEADAKWMAVNTKLCPWCKKAVERSAGCNFMACVCGKNFCYLCSRPWQPDHKDHFKCHIFKKSATDTVNRQKQILQKMNFYTERYLDNQATAVNNKRIDTFKQRKLLFQTLKIDLSDSEFIDTAFKFSIECCECLKWIYAYSYHAKWKDTIAQESFKFDQGEFERFKVNLLKMLAVDLKKFIGEVEKYKEGLEVDFKKEQKFIEEFRELKKTIVNYFTMTKKYKEKFLEEIEGRTELGMLKKKSNTNPGLERKKTDDSKGSKEKRQQKKQTVPSKIITRSSAQKQKQKPIEQPQQGKLSGWFGRHFT